MKRLFLITVFYLLIFTCGVLTSDFSSPVTYLDTGGFHIIYLTPINPVLICLREQHWVFWIYQAFHSQVLTLNTSSVANPFPVHVFLARDEEDLRIRSPWLHHPKQETHHAALFSPSATQLTVVESLDNFDVFENTQIPLLGLHSHCVALSTSSSAWGPFRFKIGFDSQLDISRVMRFGVGLLIYAISSHLVQNIAFYYFSGIGMSVLGSFLILILCAVRLFPKGTGIMQVLVVLGGGTLSLLVFCLDYVRSVLWTFAANNLKLLVAYAGIVSVLSAAVLYWLSVPEAILTRFPRTQTILLIVLRLTSICFITSAPQLPDYVPCVNRFIDFGHQWLGIEDESFLISNLPLLNRLIFGMAIGVILYVISRKFGKGSPKRKQRISESQLPPIPCAASSPCPWRVSSTVHNNGEDYMRGRENYWDLQAISPVQNNNTSRKYMPPSYGYQSMKPRKIIVGQYNGSRSQELLTDDEGDY